MRHSLRAVSLSWLIVLVPILAGSSAGADGNERLPKNDARPCNPPSCAAARTRNKAPIAENDAATTAMNTIVTINVTANDRDRDGRIARKTVRIVGGPRQGRVGKRRNGAVTYMPNPGFSGQDTFGYRVKDNRGALSNRAHVQVTVNAGPVAEAGPDQNAVTGQPVTLNGSASSDPEGNALAFSWRFLSRPPASARTDADIVNPTSPAPSFTPDVDGDYELRLTVTDGRLSDTDGVVITAAANAPPHADAGSDIVVQPGPPAETATLNGSASDDPDDFPNPTLTFQWTFVSTPAGSTLTNSHVADATTATASVIPDVPGIYLLRLDVFDGEETDFDQVLVTVQPPAPPPPPVPPPPPPPPPPFSPVQIIFNQRCTSCHGSASGLNLASNARANLVNVASNACAGNVRVVPSSAATSCLFLRVVGTTVGSRMPLGCTAGNCLSPDQIDTIEAWINGGAGP